MSISVAALQLVLLNLTMAGDMDESADVIKAHIDDLKVNEANTTKLTEDNRKLSKGIAELVISKLLLEGRVRMLQHQCIEDASTVVVGLVTDICNGLDLDIKEFENVTFEEVGPRLVGLIVQKYAVKASGTPKPTEPATSTSGVKPWILQFVPPETAIAALRLKLEGKSPVDIRAALKIDLADWGRLDDNLLRRHYVQLVSAPSKNAVDEYLLRLNERWLERWEVLQADLATKKAA